MEVVINLSVIKRDNVVCVCRFIGSLFLVWDVSCAALRCGVF